MAKLFVAQTPLEMLAHAGRFNSIVDMLRALTLEERQKLRPEVARLVKITQAARFSYGDETFAGWGKGPSDEQMRAIAAAALLCGSAKDAAESYVSVDDVIALGREFSPPSLAQMPEEMLKTTAWRVHVHDVQKLIAAGVSPRPDTNEYVLGLMLLFSHWPRHDDDVDTQFTADPGLKDALLRIFEVEGISDVSLAAVDKYAKGDRTWSKRLVYLTQRGVYSRELLIDKTLSALERGWIQFRSGWFSQFHETLAPSVEEMKPHTARYLALLASRIPPTVTFALDCVATLDVAGCIDGSGLLDAVRPVFASAVKGQIEAGFRIVDRLVKRDATYAPRAAQLIVPALVHESAQLQKQVLRRLAEWDSERSTRASLGAYAAGIAAVNREAFDVLVGVVGKSAPVKAIPPPAAQGPRNPLDPEFAIAPIETLDELVERTAYVFENDTDAEEFERVIAGLVRFAPFDEAVRVRFAAVAKRTTKVRKPVAQQVARLLHFFMTGERLESIWSQDFFGHPNLVTKYLNHRIDELSKFGLRAGGNVPLATPTHRRGCIDPIELARRLAAYRAGKIEGSKLDFADALLRLVPGAAGALTAARKLEDDDFARALRLALGDDAKPRDAELAAAARRMRDLPRRPETSARAWRIEAKKFKYGGTREILHVEPASGDFADPVTQLEREAARIPCDGWYTIGAVGSSDEGCIGFYATMLPANLESFCAEGAALLIRNVNWFQAHWEHKAYLRALLPSTVAMGPMATLLLAVGLACKEAGETAVAVDVLVQSVVEGRLDAKLLARDVAELLRTGQTAGVRYAKSLRAALRIDAAVAPALADVLCAAVEVRPADPPKDTAALLELLLEIIVANEFPMPAATRAALQAMQIGGKGKALRTKLLSLPA